jgi:hypothetical protein
MSAGTAMSVGSAGKLSDKQWQLTFRPQCRGQRQKGNSGIRGILRIWVAARAGGQAAVRAALRTPLGWPFGTRRAASAFGVLSGVAPGAFSPASVAEGRAGRCAHAPPGSVPVSDKPRGLPPVRAATPSSPSVSSRLLRPMHPSCTRPYRHPGFPQAACIRSASRTGG